MRFFDTASAFNYRWEEVTKANWQKYPNDITKHVESVDILRRDVDPRTGVLRTERLIGCRQQVPLWISQVLGTSGRAYVREVSEVDPRAGTLVMRSQNLDFASILSVTEVVQYTRDAADPKRTLFTQNATFSAGLSLKRLCLKLEEYSISRFEQNALLGRQAFEQVLNRVASI